MYWLMRKPKMTRLMYALVLAAVIVPPTSGIVFETTWGGPTACNSIER
jgi:hypothetical protein